MSNQVSVNIKSVDVLYRALKRLPEKAEYEVNNYFWNDASETLKKGVYSRMPKSSENKNQYKRRNVVPMTHAKDDESLDEVRYNLGIKIATRVKPKSKNFGYLIFPNEGRGIRQRKKGSQEFFDKTLESNVQTLQNGLISHLTNKIEEELNNE